MTAHNSKATNDKIQHQLTLFADELEDMLVLNQYFYTATEGLMLLDKVLDQEEERCHQGYLLLTRYLQQRGATLSAQLEAIRGL